VRLNSLAKVFDGLVTSVDFIADAETSRIIEPHEIEDKKDIENIGEVHK
jgi:hypothetical protein